MIDSSFSNKSIGETFQNSIPKITVLGVGGAGCNAVNNMLLDNSTDKVEFIAVNTDAQSLLTSKSPKKIQLGKQTTEGFGAGSKPEIGEKAAEESISEIKEAIQNSNILFLTAGMGGGTGSGAVPIIADIAKQQGILTIAIITTPFDFEGTKKKKIAENAINKLIPNIDSYIILPNQNLYKIGSDNLTLQQAFQLSNNILKEGVKSITDLIMIPGTINLDFADIRTVLKDGGRTIIGTSIKSGEDRALKAVEGVFNNPIIMDSDIKGAKSILVNITANPENLSIKEPEIITNQIRSYINNDDIDFAWGICDDTSMGNNLKLSIIGTGLDKIDYINKFSYEDSFINAIKEEKTLNEISKLNSTFETKLNNSFEQINTSIKEDLNNSQKINIDNETFENNKGIDFNKISNSSLWDDEIKKEPSLIKTESTENKNDDSDPEDPTPSPTKPKNKDIFADLFEKNAFDFDINETDNDTNFAVDNHSISEAPNNKFANLFDNYFTSSKQIYSNGEADNNVVPIAKFHNNNKKIDLHDTKNDKLEYLKTKELPSFLKDKRNI